MRDFFCAKMNIDTAQGPPEILTTGDGTHTVRAFTHGEPFHSLRGSRRESIHVFIRHGLQYMTTGREFIRLLEVGFGTGLNAVLTFGHTWRQGPEISYEAWELFPIDRAVARQLNFDAFSGEGLKGLTASLHDAPWESETSFGKFHLYKRHVDARACPTDGFFDLVYYDAFSPGVQPDMWTPEQMKRMYGVCSPGAALVTYCASGHVRRAMEASGFRVERLPGPPGKREMLRAVRPGIKGNEHA